MNFDPKNILIVRTDRIGDVILTTPAIKALRDAYPSAKISILVASATVDLVDGNACLDDILVDDRHNEHKGLFGFLRLVGHLRRKRFDVAIIYHTKKRTNLTCFCAGIPVRIGYKNNKFGFLLNRPVKDTRASGQQHEAQYCLDILKELGIQSQDQELYLPVKETSLLWVDQFRKDHNLQEKDQLIAIHPGASDPSKQWSPNRFAELIDILTKRYQAKVVVIGSKEVGRVAEKIASLSNSKIIDLTGQTTIGQLAGLLTRCEILVSNDSGPVHIAAGVGTPVVSIFTRNQPGINPERWKPLGANTQVVTIKPSQNHDISFKKARFMDTEYMELIGTNEVLEAVDSLYKLC